jgi:hypothetical protein
MFGMDDESGALEAKISSPAELLRKIIYREISVPLLPPLESAIGAAVPFDFASLSRAAVCLDTNLLFKALASSKRDELIDYFRARHAGPLIVSAQSMQEFWNNYHNVLDTIAKGVENKVGDLEKSLNGLDGMFDEYKDKIISVLEDFKHDNEHLFSKDLKKQVLAFIAVLREKGLESEAPRALFHDAAARRKASKVPPGFKDSGDGDFYVWLDFLYGLLLAKENLVEGGGFAKAILVTADRKIDWVKGNAAHPVLVAEVAAAVQVPFEIWSLKDLLRGINESPPTA